MVTQSNIVSVCGIPILNIYLTNILGTKRHKGTKIKEIKIAMKNKTCFEITVAENKLQIGFNAKEIAESYQVCMLVMEILQCEVFNFRDLNATGAC